MTPKIRSPSDKSESFQNSSSVYATIYIVSILGLSITAIFVGLRIGWTNAGMNQKQNTFLSEFMESPVSCAYPLRKDEIKELIIQQIFHGQSPYQDFPPPGK